MRFLLRSLGGIFLLSVTAGILVLAGNSVYSALQASWAEEERQRPSRERVFAVNVLTIEPQTITPVLETFGEVRSSRTLEVRASSGGELVWLSPTFEEGGQVRQGDLIAKIDPADAQSAMETATADLAEAEADVRDAARNLDIAQDDLAAAQEQAALQERALARQRDLLSRAVGTEAAVETAELAAASARQSVLSKRQSIASSEAAVDQTQTALIRRQIALEQAERDLKDTEIFAGISGTVTGATIVEGRLVSANETLGEIVDPRALEISFRVSTSQYARLLDDTGRLLGSPVTVSIDVLGVDLVATGKISRESAAVASGQTGRLLFATLENPIGFRPGDFATVTIEEPDLERVVLVPSSAVDAAQTVLVIAEEDRLEVAGVEILRRQGDDTIIRARGLRGREIVEERTPLLGAGIKVRPVRQGEQTEVPTGPEMVTLDPDRRARLVAFVEQNNRMPAEAKARVLGQLNSEEVPLQVVERIESRMGG